MSSDDTARISFDQAESITVEAEVDSLRVWEKDPFHHDIPRARLRNFRFGQLRRPIVYGDEVLWGGAIVLAEKDDPLDDGRIRVIDLERAGWSREQAMAAALSETMTDRLSTVDDIVLAETLLELQTHDAGLLPLIGFDADDLDQILADLGDIETQFEPVEPSGDSSWQPGDVEAERARLEGTFEGDTRGAHATEVVCPSCFEEFRV